MLGSARAVRREKGGNLTIVNIYNMKNKCSTFDVLHLFFYSNLRFILASSMLNGTAPSISSSS